MAGAITDPGFAPFATWSRAIHPPITDEGLARRWERIGAVQRAAWGAVAAHYLIEHENAEWAKALKEKEKAK